MGATVVRRLCHSDFCLVYTRVVIHNTVSITLTVFVRGNLGDKLTSVAVNYCAGESILLLKVDFRKTDIEMMNLIFMKLEFHYIWCIEDHTGKNW